LRIVHEMTDMVEEDLAGERKLAIGFSYCLLHGPTLAGGRR
jgi:hypothetical protein